MAHRTLAGAPTTDELAKLTDVEQYVVITRFAHSRGTLTSALARLRKAALVRALADPETTGAALARIAEVEVSPGRISQLLKLARAGINTATSPEATS